MDSSVAMQNVAEAAQNLSLAKQGGDPEDIRFWVTIYDYWYKKYTDPFGTKTYA